MIVTTLANMLKQRSTISKSVKTIVGFTLFGTMTLTISTSIYLWLNRDWSKRLIKIRFAEATDDRPYVPVDVAWDQDERDPSIIGPIQFTNNSNEPLSLTVGSADGLFTHVDLNANEVKTIDLATKRTSYKTKITLCNGNYQAKTVIRKSIDPTKK
jgi:hypothetical protein